jgi:copper chaperone CopZ
VEVGVQRLYTAVIQLREPSAASARALIEPALRSIRGVHSVVIEPSDWLVAVKFNRDLVGLADLVRAIEDAGAPVWSVAERRGGPLKEAG